MSRHYPSLRELLAGRPYLGGRLEADLDRFKTQLAEHIDAPGHLLTGKKDIPANFPTSLLPHRVSLLDGLHVVEELGTRLVDPDGELIIRIRYYLADHGDWLAAQEVAATALRLSRHPVDEMSPALMMSALAWYQLAHELRVDGGFIEDQPYGRRRQRVLQRRLMHDYARCVS